MLSYAESDVSDYNSDDESKDRSWHPQQKQKKQKKNRVVAVAVRKSFDKVSFKMKHKVFEEPKPAPILCTVCCDVFEKSYLCDFKHHTCQACLPLLFNMRVSNINTDFGLISEYEKEQRCYLIQCQCVEGCDARFSLKSTRNTLPDEFYDSWYSANSELCLKINKDIWQQEQADKTQQEKEDSSIREQFTDVQGNITAYQCPNCSFGPVDFSNCDDLSYHHGDPVYENGTSDKVISYTNNACHSCGFYATLIQEWSIWDGTIRKLDKTVLPQYDPEGIFKKLYDQQHAEEDSTKRDDHEQPGDDEQPGEDLANGDLQDRRRIDQDTRTLRMMGISVDDSIVAQLSNNTLDEVIATLYD